MTSLTKLGASSVGSLYRVLRRIVRGQGDFSWGIGYPGERPQRLRSKQIEVLRSLTRNETFIVKYPRLLACNEMWCSVADKVDVSAVLETYFAASKQWNVYPSQVPTLEDWVDLQGHAWPNVHPAHQHVVDTYRELRPRTVCEVGAGAGVVSKYVYAASGGDVDLTCLEGAATHREAMKLNFSKNSTVIAPQLEVRARIVDGLAQCLPFETEAFDLVYTCTVMMHIPFIAAVLAACELARVSARYVLHVEGYHTDGIVSGFREPHNLLLIDYERLYAELGFRTLKKSFYQDPYGPDYDYVVFLAEKEKPKDR